VLPLNLSLVGANIYHQMVPFGLGAAGNLQQVTATNAVQLTIGAL